MSWTHLLRNVGSRRSLPVSWSVYVDGHSIPVSIFYEPRSNVRIALGRHAVLLRIPHYCNMRQREKYHDWCKSWIIDQWKNNPRFRATLLPFEIQGVVELQLSDQKFQIAVEITSNKSASAYLSDETIHLKLPDQWSEDSKNEIAYKLIHRVIASHYLPSFEKRTQELHAGQFGKEIISVCLRNMSSKWGSCSQTGKLSLSTRLLFTPMDVQKYVLLHELCHLDELNHSRAFWDRVRSIDPYYQDKEKWLDTHGHLCDLKFAVVRHVS